MEQTVDEMRAELAKGGIGFAMTDEEVPSFYRSIILGIPSEDPPEEPAGAMSAQSHWATYPHLVCQAFVHGRGDSVEIRRRPDENAPQAYLYAVYVNGSPVNDQIQLPSSAYEIAWRYGMPKG